MNIFRKISLLSCTAAIGLALAYASVALAQDGTNGLRMKNPKPAVMAQADTTDVDVDESAAEDTEAAEEKDVIDEEPEEIAEDEVPPQPELPEQTEASPIKPMGFAPPADLMPAPQETKIVDLPPIPVEPTHPMLRLTLDKSEILNLDVPAKTVIVGGEQHLGVFIDQPQRLVMVPRAPGAGYFTVMDEDGQVIMQRHVIVATPKEKYIRVRRSCALSSGNCAPMQTFYCPDMCHEIAAPEGELSSPSTTAASSSNNATPGSIPNPVGGDAPVSPLQ